jgi:dihydroorotase
MTLYLTNNTAADEIVKAVDSECVFACKLYPAGATTHSDAGVTDIRAIDDVLGAMQEKGLPLLVHGESTDPDIDVFDREQFFIKDTLIPTVKRFPDLKVVFEHVTTAHAVEFVTGAGSNIAATITAHHLLLNRNAMFQGGIRPHHYCLPVLKRETHRKALMKAATGASGKFFLGTDSAPHSQGKKESACGCAGMYTAPLAMPLYAEAFESADALDKLEGFASLFGPDFYGLEQNKDKISLVRESLSIDESLPLGDEKIVPFRAGGTINWQVK